MRTDSKLKFTCNVCNEPLEIDELKVFVSFDSAYDTTFNIALKPCNTCFTKASLSSNIINSMIKEVVKETLKKQEKEK